MKTYFIADDNGNIYAHDIQTKAKAEAILADLVTALKNDGEEIPEGLEVLHTED